MTSIMDLLHRRSDLSTFLVHLTRGYDGKDAKENFISIIADRTIEARSPLGMAAQHEQYLAGSLASQKVACFSETPLEHTWMMIEDIDLRSVQMSSYGVVFTKTMARKQHCNPVWYIDISTRGGRDWLTVPVNELVAQAIERCTDSYGHLDAATLADEPILRLTPFFEQMGPTKSSRKEFWWEREWRHMGDFQFFASRVVALLAPEAEHSELRDFVVSQNWNRVPPFLDPKWGLERMIASMSGIDDEYIGPFPEPY